MSVLLEAVLGCRRPLDILQFPEQFWIKDSNTFSEGILSGPFGVLDCVTNVELLRGDDRIHRLSYPPGRQRFGGSFRLRQHSRHGSNARDAVSAARVQVPFRLHATPSMLTAVPSAKPFTCVFWADLVHAEQRHAATLHVLL